MGGETTALAFGALPALGDKGSPAGRRGSARILGERQLPVSAGCNQFRLASFPAPSPLLGGLLGRGKEMQAAASFLGGGG